MVFIRREVVGPQSARAEQFVEQPGAFQGGHFIGYVTNLMDGALNGTFRHRMTCTETSAGVSAADIHDIENAPGRGTFQFHELLHDPLCSEAGERHLFVAVMVQVHVTAELQSCQFSGRHALLIEILHEDPPLVREDGDMCFGGLELRCRRPPNGTYLAVCIACSSWIRENNLNQRRKFTSRIANRTRAHRAG